MDKYFTAKTAEALGSPYRINGLLYTRAKRKCPKCGGSGQYLHFGECFTCHGAGYIIEEVRLYTAEELAEVRAKLAQKDDEDAAQREEKDKAQWLTRNGFTTQGETHIILGGTFAIKDQLKDLGFKYSQYIKWHAATPPRKNLDPFKVQKIQIDDYYIWAPGQKAYIITQEGRARLEKLYAEAPLNSEWYGAIGDKISRVKVTLCGSRATNSAWGEAIIFSFMDAENHLFSWCTSSSPDIPQGEFYLSATIKSHATNRSGEKVTYIQRAKLEAI